MNQHGLVHGSMSGVYDRLEEVLSPTVLGSQDADIVGGRRRSVETLTPSMGRPLSVGALTPLVGSPLSVGALRPSSEGG